VVTAGPTREPLDPVRFLSNYSSGKMGFAIAQAAVLLGAETTLISGPTSLMPPSGAKLISIESTSQLFDSVKREFKQSDCLIMAAAPADFTPGKVAAQKMKKATAGYSLALQPTVDILKEVAAKKKGSQVVVGIAIETENAVSNARKKLKEKNLDMVVLNRPGKQTGFVSDTNRVTLLIPGKKPEKWPLMDKSEIACKLLGKIAAML
jgi:phosphopantothenoylcysteine decarboxylase/phosphopantothenate--cysteine ligase